MKRPRRSSTTRTATRTGPGPVDLSNGPGLHAGAATPAADLDDDPIIVLREGSPGPRRRSDGQVACPGTVAAVSVFLLEPGLQCSTGFSAQVLVSLAVLGIGLVVEQPGRLAVQVVGRPIGRSSSTGFLRRSPPPARAGRRASRAKADGDCAPRGASVLPAHRAARRPASRIGRCTVGACGSPVRAPYQSA